MGKRDKKSVYLSYLLRHHPEDVGLSMDIHGWVSVDELIAGINRSEKYRICLEELEEIVAQDSKGRYRFDKNKEKIKACQGHSITWVEPELEYKKPPEYLYHGTNTEALKKILESGAILKMNRHAVHMQEECKRAWKSAVRWKKIPVVLKIAAEELSKTGVVFGVSENQVWCAYEIPKEYIVECLYEVK